VLRVVDLSVRYRGADSTLQAVSGVSFELPPGTVLGIVGESGCGKSTVARAVLRLLPRGTEVSGQVLLGERDVLAASRQELVRLRWSEIAMVFQDALNSLNPVIRIGSQLTEAIRRHEPVSRAAAAARARELVQLVGLDPGVVDRHPHELSGGMRQRVCIAMAFACRPRVLLADEPTTALDVITQDRVIEEMLKLREDDEQAMVFISHDIALVSEISDQIGVMYAGHLVELGTVRDVLFEPAHPYTMGLLNAFPRADTDKEVVSIPGDTARFSETPGHCPFIDRCPFAIAACGEAPPPVTVAPGHWSACHRAAEAPRLRELSGRPETWRPQVEPALAGAGEDTLP
jgi:oligopeptide/dipeptide ABC transporter ATP-binding protein